jgi:hypothetical protein
MEINRMTSLSQIKSTQAPQVKKEVETSGDSVQLGSDKAVPEGLHKKWLFMNYIGADCNLKEFQARNIDNQELTGSDANTHIVAFIDVGPGREVQEAKEGEEKAESEPSCIDFKGARTYYVTKDTTPNKLNSPVIAEHGMDVKTSDPGVLTKFIVDTMKKFPSDHVALILNDHGGGFTGAISDDTQGGFMSTPQIKQALADAEKVTGKKIDILGFDACLMAAAEVAHEVKDQAHFLLASEETEGGPGWTYNEMLDPQKAKEAAASKGKLQQNPSMPEAISMLQAAMGHKIEVSPEEFCKIVVKVNEQHQGDICTFSATDLTKAEVVTKATDELAKAILDTSQKAEVKEAIMNAKGYGGWQQPQPYSDMKNLTEVAQLIDKKCSDPKLKEAAAKVIKATGEAVIANESDQQEYAGSQGLSVYAPVDKPEIGYGYDKIAFANETKWDEAMKELGKLPNPKPEGKTFELFSGINIDTLPETPATWPDGSPRS